MLTLKFYRRKQGFSQRDMAEYLEIDQSSYCRKERGDAPFTIWEAKKLADKFNQTIEDLFFTEII